MARAAFINDPAFALFLSDVGKWYPSVAEAALRAGSAVIADEMKKNLSGVLSPKATGQLIGAFGITPIRQNRDSNWNLHIGFDGYQEPGHTAFQLIARSFESGAVIGGRRKKAKSEMEYWRKPTRFASKAVKAKRAEAEAKMKEAAERAMEELLRTGGGTGG